MGSKFNTSNCFELLSLIHSRFRNFYRALIVIDFIFYIDIDIDIIDDY